MYRFFVFILLFTAQNALAQDKAVGSWASHFAYNECNTVAYDGKDKIYAAGQNLYSFSKMDQEYTVYSKVNGLSDVGIDIIRYNQEEDYLVIIYQNSNIDILQNENLINIPDIKNVQISGSKKINDVYFFNSFVYLSTDFGIVVLDPNRTEIKETYALQNGSTSAQVKGLSTFQGNFIAATDQGLFSADINSPVLQDFNNWTIEDNRPLKQIVANTSTFYTIDENHLYHKNTLGAGLDTLYTALEPITQLNLEVRNLYLSINGAAQRGIYVIDVNNVIVDSFNGIFSKDVTEVGNEFAFAGGWNGMELVGADRTQFRLKPDGPFSNANFNIDVSDDKLWVSAGGHAGWNYLFSSSGFSSYDFNDWKWYNRFENIPAMDTTFDIISVRVDPVNKSIYAASFGGGLLEIQTDNTIINHENNGFISEALGDGGSNRVYDLAFDGNNNLWMTNYAANHQLIVKKQEGGWEKFALPYPGGSGGKNASNLVIDNINQKWIVAPRGIGLFVFNDNNTLSNKNDDVTRLLTTGLGRGNLPNSFINCIAKDQDGIIWVGTADGIGIFNCPENVLTSNGCDAELRVVQYDENAGLLFQSENVTSIAVDGGNNKWIGTLNGVWKISDDAETILERFTVDNSPLPSNEINKIAIHPRTGDVFFATNSGLVSYRANATAANKTNENILVFPNPVPVNYDGTIAIRGLTENADVRITDVSGQLVYRTKAQGGQAVWNGKTYTGKTPMTGVYYVFVTNADGSQTKTTKFIFNE